MGWGHGRKEDLTSQESARRYKTREHDLIDFFFFFGTLNNHYHRICPFGKCLHFQNLPLRSKCCLLSSVKRTGPGKITTGSYTKCPGLLVYPLTASEPSKTIGGWIKNNNKNIRRRVYYSQQGHSPRPRQGQPQGKPGTSSPPPGTPPTARGLRAACSRPGAACGHSQEVLHGDADD